MQTVAPSSCNILYTIATSFWPAKVSVERHAGETKEEESIGMQQTWACGTGKRRVSKRKEARLEYLHLLRLTYKRPPILVSRFLLSAPRHNSE
jgi:hypothetical protein